MVSGSHHMVGAHSARQKTLRWVMLRTTQTFWDWWTPSSYIANGDLKVARKSLSYQIKRSMLMNAASASCAINMSSKRICISILLLNATSTLYNVCIAMSACLGMRWEIIGAFKVIQLVRMEMTTFSLRTELAIWKKLKSFSNSCNVLFALTF